MPVCCIVSGVTADLSWMTHKERKPHCFILFPGKLVIISTRAQQRLSKTSPSQCVFERELTCDSFFKDRSIWLLGELKITCHIRKVCSTTICHPPLSKASSGLTLTGCLAVQWVGPAGHNGGRIWKGRYISWTLIGWLTFTMLPSGMGQRTSEGERRREIRLWAIRLMKEGNGVKGQEKVALRQISLEESWTNCSDSFRAQHWDTDWQRRNKSQDTLSLGERITLNVLF